MARPTRIAALLCSLLALIAPERLAGNCTLPPAPSVDRQYDFGLVRQGEKVSHTFSVPGDPAVPVLIARVDLTQADMTARFDPRVPAGGSASVTITWNTARVTGPVEGQAVVRWADKARSPLTLTLRGRVRPIIEILPLPAVFFSVYRDELVEQTVTIRNYDDAPVHITRMESAGEHFTARLRAVRPGQEYQLSVAVPSGGAPGRYLESLVLHTDHPIRPRVRIAVNVLIKRDIHANPDEVDFGDVSVDELRRSPSLTDLLTQTILVKRREGPFEIRSVRSDVAALRIVKSPDGPSQIFRLDVMLDPARLERSTLGGSIRLATSDPAFPEITVPVRGVLR